MVWVTSDPCVLPVSLLFSRSWESLYLRARLTANEAVTRLPSWRLVNLDQDQSEPVACAYRNRPETKDTSGHR